jgi:hypothetical protein
MPHLAGCTQRGIDFSLALALALALTLAHLFAAKPTGDERMSVAYQIVVCGGIVPDPLQTLEPVTGAAGPVLKNEIMLPAVLDPWAWHAAASDDDRRPEGAV